MIQQSSCVARRFWLPAELPLCFRGGLSCRPFSGPLAARRFETAAFSAPEARRFPPRQDSRKRCPASLNHGGRSQPHARLALTTVGRLIRASGCLQPPWANPSARPATSNHRGQTHPCVRLPPTTVGKPIRASGCLQPPWAKSAGHAEKSFYQLFASKVAVFPVSPPACADRGCYQHKTEQEKGSIYGY